MDCQAPLIYRGRIIADDVSELDLLRWTGHGYFAGDIKSGAGEEGRGGGRTDSIFWTQMRVAICGIDNRDIELSPASTLS